MGSRLVGIVVAIVIVAALGAGAFYWWQRSEPPYLPPEKKAETRPADTGPKHPLPAETTAPLPTLNESDAPFGKTLSELIGSPALQRFLNLDGLIRRIVATVDNLPRESVAARVNAVKPLGGAFVTRGRDTSLVVAPENAARYGAVVRLVQQLDARQAVALYVRFYPLFQEAYVELGYPGKYFNDRLVEAIDDLLEAPEIEGPIALAQPHVLYEYADPELESRSAGQKLMMRIGRANESAVKGKLRELREEILAAGQKR
jgi:DUF3014 family protein